MEADSIKKYENVTVGYRWKVQIYWEYLKVLTGEPKMQFV